MYAKIPLAQISKIQIVQAACTKTVAQVKKATGAQYVFNGGLYNMTTKEPLCKLRVDGKTYANDQYGYWCYAWDKGPDIQIIHSDAMERYQNCIACIAVLKDGKDTILTYDKDVSGMRPRTAMGLDASGNLVLYCDKAKKTVEQTREIMRGHGCVSALCMDGGGSTSGDFNGTKVTTTRKVANYVCVFVKASQSICPYTEPTALVRRGSIGEGSKWVQWYLNAVAGSELAVDGIFGNKSVAALKKFQIQNQLTCDGICGAATRKKLKEVAHG